jgi:flavin reductase (DIM6/NTAB) family NADH-FMN oxidoreductase RutF
MLHPISFDLESGPAGRAYKLLVGLVAPRPIALITSMDENGQLNAAPFSAYNYLYTDPPIVGVGVTNRPGQPLIPKDTARNIRRAGGFVVNVVTEDIAKKMNICATDFPPEMSEVEPARFAAGRCTRSTRMPRVHDHRDRPLPHHPGACCCHLR